MEKTQNEKLAEAITTRLREFFTKCKTRGGAPHKVIAIQTNAMKIPVSIRGEVTFPAKPAEGTTPATDEKTIPFYWNTQGVSMMGQTPETDLIEEELI